MRWRDPNQAEALEASRPALIRRSGYRSQISYADADYFNVSANDERIAKAVRTRPVPSLDDIRMALEHLTKRLNRLWIHMTARIRFNIPTGTKEPVMNGKALFQRFARTCRCCNLGCGTDN
jgi:hypothetical protein